MNFAKMPSTFSSITCALSIAAIGAIGIIGQKTSSSSLGLAAEGSVFWALIVVAAIGTVLIYVLPQRREFWFSVSIVFADFLVLLFLFQLNLAVVLAFAALLLVQLAVYERFPANLGGAIAVIVTVFFALRTNDEIPAQQAVMYCFVVFVIYIFGSLTTYYRERLIPLVRYSKEIQNSIVVLSRANYMLQDSVRNIEVTSRNLERKRLSRDLHDGIGYMLTNQTLMLETIKVMSTTEPAAIPEYVEKIRLNTEYGRNEIRETLRDVRSKDISQVPITVMLKRLVSTFSASTRVTVNIEFGNITNAAVSLHAEVIYHLVQEGLINSFRHGHASHILITFWQETTCLRVTLTDNGRGPPPILREGIGLSGMRERIEASSGTFHFGGESKGFKVTAVLPLVWKSS